MQTNIVNRSKIHMETLHKYDWKKINFILTITQQHAYERACPSSGYRLCRGEGHLNYYLNGHHRDDCAQRNPNPLENEDPLIFLITSVFDTKTKTPERLFSLFFFFFRRGLKMSSSVLKLSSKEPITSSCFLKDQQSIKCLSLKSGTGFIPLLVVIYLHPRHLIQTKCPGTSELRTIFWGFISICRFEMLDFVFQKKEN